MFVIGTAVAGVFHEIETAVVKEDPVHVEVLNTAAATSFSYA